MRIAADKIAGLDWTLRSGGRAYLALDSTLKYANRKLKPEYVGYALARHRDGSHFFLGDCSDYRLTDPIRETLGTRFDTVMDQIVGKSGKQVVKLVGGKKP